MNGVSVSGIGIDSVLRSAINYDKTVSHGCAAGLSEDETREVIAAWSKYHQGVTRALDWREVRQACVSRAMGERWEP